MDAERLREGLRTMGWEPDPAVVAALCAHWELVREAGRGLNLTSIDDDDEALERHYLDSAAVLGALAPTGIGPGSEALIADLGSGAGFPGLVLALLAPRWRVELIESRGGKAAFLRDAVAHLAPGRVQVHERRARELGREGALQADLVLARAAGPIIELPREAKGLLRPGGWLGIYRGQGTEGEDEAARRAVRLGYGSIALAFVTVPAREPRTARFFLARLSRP